MPDVNLTVFAPETASLTPPLTVTSVSDESASSAGFTSSIVRPAPGSSSVPLIAFLLTLIFDSGLGGTSSTLSFITTKFVFESTTLSSGLVTVDTDDSTTPSTILNLTSAVT